MRQHEHMLIIIADGEHARYVRPSPTHVLHTERRIDSATAHKRASDLKSDGPGASYHSDSTAHHALAPRHDPHRSAAENFSRFIADEVNAMPASGFDALLVVAPAHSLAIILEHLHGTAKARLAGSIAKDLTKVPDDALWPHLQDFVPRARPARHL